MNFLRIIFGLLLILLVLWDTFETIILPRIVTRGLRLTRLTLRLYWLVDAALLRLKPKGSFREFLLGIYGPSAMIALVGVWALLLVFGFTFIQWGLNTPLSASDGAPSFGTHLYMSGATFFTLGFGDVTAKDNLGRFVSIVEAGTGFGFLALVIGYLPILYQAFSRREWVISLLDARAGSPPSAVELLFRYGQRDAMASLEETLRSWEQWSAELLESYISYPILAFYRSQHEGLSWLTALTLMLDTCTLIQVNFQGDRPWQKTLRWQASLTYAMARHVMVDLALIIDAPPNFDASQRLTPEQEKTIRTRLSAVGLPLLETPDANRHFFELRRQYEPYAIGLASGLDLELPFWLVERPGYDNWQTSAWEKGSHF